MSNESKLGLVEFQGKDFATPAFPFDKIAVSGRSQLLLVSLVAPTQNLKQIRAILAGGAKATIQAAGVKVKRPSDSDWYANQAGKLAPCSDGYRYYSHKLGYGQAQSLFVTHTPGFMIVVTPESLWQELNDKRFTTPLLREWMPYIEQELRDQGLLEEAHVFNCNCGVLSATTKHLDNIVSDGLRHDKIRIPRSSVA